jgi:VWFA-related protein
MFPASSQVQPAADAPVFKTRSELVTVPVVVTDKNGAHLHDLKKEDFKLLEDGKPQNIASFEEIQRPPAPTVPSPGNGRFSNTLTASTRPVNLTIVVLDLLNTPLEDQAIARNALLKYLANPAAGAQPTIILALTRNGLRVIHDFATDTKSLSAALGKAPGEHQLVEQANQEAIPAGTSPEVAKALEMLRETEQRLESQERLSATRITLDAMLQIARSCAGLPGRKALLWAGDGFPLMVTPAGTLIDQPSYRDVADPYQKTWNALNDAQVAVYPVDMRGMTNPDLADVSMRHPRQGYYSEAEWLDSETLATFQTFAQETGGRAFYRTNDFTGAFLKANEDNSDYYLLSYYLENTDKKKPGWHRLSVHVQRAGAQVRARSGFFLTTGNLDDSNDREVNLALRSPLNYTGVSITGQWEKVEAATQPGKKKAVFLLTMPANFAEVDEKDHNHIKLEFAAVAIGPTGETVAETRKTIDGHPEVESLTQIRSHGVDYRGDLILPPGDYTVRFAVRDRLSGRMGSVSTTLTVTP